MNYKSCFDIRCQDLYFKYKNKVSSEQIIGAILNINNTRTCRTYKILEGRIEYNDVSLDSEGEFLIEINGRKYNILVRNIGGAFIEINTPTNYLMKPFGDIVGFLEDLESILEKTKKEKSERKRAKSKVLKTNR